MLTVLISWMVILLTFVSWGDMTVHLWNRLSASDEEYGITPLTFIGLATSGILACIVNLFMPLNIYVTVFIVLVAAIYLAANFQRFKQLFKKCYKEFRNTPILTKGVISAIGILILTYCLLVPGASPSTFDTGLYHQQSMLWADQYSIIPGLANLHGRFAFNSNSLLIYTLFFFHPDYLSPQFSINGLLLFLLFVWLILKSQNGESVLKTGIIYLLIFILSFTFIRIISSSLTDLFVAILTVYLLISFVLEENPEKSKLVYLLLPLFCVTLKLSALFVCLLSIPILYSALKNKNWKTIYLYIGMALLIGLPWLARYIVLSGYLVYPFPAIDIFSFDWKIPIEKVIEEKDAVTLWARHPGSLEEIPFSQWFPSWISSLGKTYLFCYLAILASPLIILFASLKKKSFVNNYTIAWSVAFVGAAFNFIMAPDPRFSIGFIVGTIFIPILYLFSLNWSLIQISNLKIINIFQILTIFALIILSFNTFRALKLYQQDESLLSLMYKPQPFDYVRKSLNTQFEIRNVSGINIYIPNKDIRCFDQCLPCMPFFDERIEMRGQSLENGFRINTNKSN